MKVFMRNVKTKTRKRIEFDCNVRNEGNWNYKRKLSKPVYTKPIGFISFEDIELVFSHEDLLRLLSIYLEADLVSIAMIKNGSSGNITSYEQPFNDKVLDWVKKSKGGKL